jgi:hypothetical protein
MLTPCTPLRCDALHVHQRRLAGHGDGFGHPADPQVRVDHHRRRAGQRDILALHDVEAGERKRHVIRAGAQVGDPVLAAAVADGRAHPFDQRRTAGLDRDTRQHRARRVLHHAGEDRLCKDSRRHEQHADEHDDHKADNCTHEQLLQQRLGRGDRNDCEARTRYLAFTRSVVKDFDRGVD